MILSLAFAGSAWNRYAVDFWNGKERWWVAVLIGLLTVVYFALILLWWETLIPPWWPEAEEEYRKSCMVWQKSPGYKTKFQSDYVQSQDEKESDE